MNIESASTLNDLLNEALKNKSSSECLNANDNADIFSNENIYPSMESNISSSEDSVTMPKNLYNDLISKLKWRIQLYLDNRIIYEYVLQTGDPVACTGETINVLEAGAFSVKSKVINYAEHIIGLHIEPVNLVS